jgi:hypothetical protein
MNYNKKLSIIHPDTVECDPITPPSLFTKRRIEYCNPDYNSSKAINYINNSEYIDTLDEANLYEREIKEQSYYKGIYYVDAMDMETTLPENTKQINLNNIKKITSDDVFYARKFNEIKDKIGDGKMDYIKDKNTKEMCTNAWKAITCSNNWDFVAQDIDSFIWSNDSRINVIANKMEDFGYNYHSGCSFGYTMRMMQFLVKNGENEFKKICEKQNDSAIKKFLDYSGGF